MPEQYNKSAGRKETYFLPGTKSEPSLLLLKLVRELMTGLHGTDTGQGRGRCFSFGDVGLLTGPA